MALYYNLPIYRATYTLLFTLTQILPNLPRDARYSLGMELRKEVTDIIVMIYRANRSYHKMPILQRMREKVVIVQLYLRLMCDMKYIPESKYLSMMEQVSNISKQLVAWAKSVKESSTGSQSE